MDIKEHIAIFTTASLPWLTGTAVNPLFRAAYLANDITRKVTLVIPWLSVEHQKLVYSSDITFKSTSEHKAYVLQWLKERIEFSPDLNILFYPGMFSVDKRSILAVGDITEVISDEDADVAVLEEPEHLTWFHHGSRWNAKFRVVIGIVHTNYLEYVKRDKNGWFRAFFLKYLNVWVVGIYCHKVIRLSAATQDYHNSTICNVHGVNPKFLVIGKNLLEGLKSANQPFDKGVYYIGKMVWSKGYKELLDLLRVQRKAIGNIQVDLYGSGEDSDQVQKVAEELGNVRVFPGRDHSDVVFHQYKVFLNPSTSDVVCTTTAEALAMGKFVVCADHPSNEFFKQFQNCLTYNSDTGFAMAIEKALKEEPSRLLDEQRYQLSWEAATQRFLRAAELDHPPRRPGRALSKGKSRLFSSASFNMHKNMDDASAFLHYMASGHEMARRAFGAIPRSIHPDEALRLELGLPLPTKKGCSNF